MHLIIIESFSANTKNNFEGSRELHSINVSAAGEVKSSGNKTSTVVMEMVEAIIDNNYDVNSPSRRIGSSELSSDRARDDKSNFDTTTSLRAPLKAQMAEHNEQRLIGDKKWLKVQRKGKLMLMMMASERIHSTNCISA